MTAGLRSSVVVTVGLPVYNGERFIEHAIKATLTQTYEPLELIISDNASSDGTEAICRKWVSQDPRVRYVRSSINQGMAWNYSRVLELAQGEYFKWAAADDVYSPDFLTKCVEVLENDQSVVVACTRTIFIDDAGSSVKCIDPGWNLCSGASHERLKAVILKGGHWANADALSGVIRTDALRRTNLFPDYQGGDKRPLAELSLMGKFVEIPEYLLFRRRHDSASSMNNPAFRGYDSSSVKWMTEFFKGSPLRVCLPTWNLTLDYLAMICRSKLGMTSKIRLVGTVMRAGWWYKEFLIQELKVTSRILVETALYGTR